MPLTEGQQSVKDIFPYLWECQEQFGKKMDRAMVDIIDTRSGPPTVQISGEKSQTLYIHSKYDPIKEADRLVEQYRPEMEEYDQVLFYGLGFGYHIEAFIGKYPDKKYSVYEPSHEIFTEFIANSAACNFSFSVLKHLFVEYSMTDTKKYMAEFAEQLEDKVLLISLPSYERAFTSQFNHFNEAFKNTVQEKVFSLGAKVAFSKRWVINSLMNLQTTLATPDLLTNKRNVFKDKPVILAAAGPSLADEYDNLRYIKKNGLAYIFAVGSANKALIANDIYPDAVCTYDPQGHNYKVFQPMMEKNITSVPMIYGTSVGYETLEKYKGPKLHVITSQDTITPYFFNMEEQGDYVNDAFSIAIIMLQALAKMQVGSVILVGQNFAFRDQNYYSKDINRGNTGTSEVQEKDLKNKMTTIDVYGNKVETNESFHQMKLLMESYIQTYSNLRVINTSKGGAQIEGAPFIPLTEVTKEILGIPVVEKGWYEYNPNSLDLQLHSKIRKFLRGKNECIRAFELVSTVLEDIQKQISKDERKLETLFVKLDKAIRKLTNGDFYKSCILPITKVYYEKLTAQIQDIREEQSASVKADKIVQAFGAYMTIVIQTYNEISPTVKESLNRLLDNENGRQAKSYKNDCGAFSYSEGWERGTGKPDQKSHGYVLRYQYTKQKGAVVSFKFHGTSFKVLAGKRNDYSTNIKITVDGQSKTVSTRDKKASETFIFNDNQVIYETNGLSDKMHNVEIELLDDKMFVFNGIEMNGHSRLYHNDEVTRIGDLEIGKRLRCHYQATFNQVGTFSNLGEEKKMFIPPESSDYPDGDFYFIMVDEENGIKKLIADRNVQHHLSWDNLDQEGWTSDTWEKSGILTWGNNIVKGSLPSGESMESDWDKYIVNCSLKRKIKPGCNFTWNWDCGAVTWTKSRSFENEMDYVILRGAYFSVKGAQGTVDSSIVRNKERTVRRGFRPLIKIYEYSNTER